MGADELEEHQAYGDSTLGCNEATEQHSEQSDRARGAARRGASALECRCNLTASPTLSLLLSNKPPLHYLTTFIFASAHLLSTFPHVHQLIRSSTSQHFADQRYYLCFSQFSINEKVVHHSTQPFRGAPYQQFPTRHHRRRSCPSTPPS